MYAAKKDINHDEIAQVFDTFGYKVINTFMCHGVLLDFIADKFRSGDVWYVEVKSNKYSQLTLSEKKFIAENPERSIVIYTVQQAIEFCQKQAR
jgi:hypothetical protein